jgi:hypothetical protein
MQQVNSFEIPTRPLLFPENQRFKNKMIYYAHHCKTKCVTSQDSTNALIYFSKKKMY